MTTHQPILDDDRNHDMSLLSLELARERIRDAERSAAQHRELAAIRARRRTRREAAALRVRRLLTTL